MTEPLKLGEERLEHDEEVLTKTLQDIILARMAKTYGEGKTMLRDAHPKTHGMLKAKFIVPDDLPEELRHGLFAKPGSYDALVRFSSSLQVVLPDLVMQPQGMSIKVFGVEGEKLAEAEKNAKTQDFVMINYPTFFIRDLPTYVAFNQAQSDGTLAAFAKDNEDVVNVLMHMLAQRVFNPSRIQYWSQTPYKLGPHACKYSANPLDPSDPRPTKMGLNFMRDLLVESAGKGPTIYEFLIQVQNDPVKQPVEDPMVEWLESEAPPQRAALIEIPQQDISSGKDLEVAENLSFMVWHSLPEHRPLGSMNRPRLTIYTEGSKLRHAHNSVKREEPDEMPEF